jgi:hypothetical protein
MKRRYGSRKPQARAPCTDHHFQFTISSIPFDSLYNAFLTLWHLTLESEPMESCQELELAARKAPLHTDAATTEATVVNTTAAINTVHSNDHNVTLPPARLYMLSAVMALTVFSIGMVRVSLLISRVQPENYWVTNVHRMLPSLALSRRL